MQSKVLNIYGFNFVKFVKKMNFVCNINVIKEQILHFSNFFGRHLSKKEENRNLLQLQLFISKNYLYNMHIKTKGGRMK